MKDINISVVFEKICQYEFEEVFESAIKTNNNNIVISFVNPYSSIVLINDDNFIPLIEGIDYLFADGILQVYASRFFFNKTIRRYSFDFSSIADYVFNFCSSNKLSVGVIGGTLDEVELFVKKMNNRYTFTNKLIYHSGYFDSPDHIGEFLKTVDTDIIILGMGTPLQEEVAIMAKKCSKSKLIITCGGFISQTSKRDDYYHPFIKKMGLRWLQRAYLEPHYRIRLFKQYPTFLYRLVKFKISRTIFR